MAIQSKITPCIWFDSQAEAAAEQYVSIFPDSGIDVISRYGKEGFEIHQQPEGAVMAVTFHILGQSFMGLNGGPMFKLSEAISFQVGCDTQDEIDRYWARLTEGGAESSCGWLKDRFGVSWQILPSKLGEWMNGADRAAASRVAQAFLPMKKLDIATIERAFRGE